jgi:hypothetical protein
METPLKEDLMSPVNCLEVRLIENQSQNSFNRSRLPGFIQRQKNKSIISSKMHCLVTTVKKVKITRGSTIPRISGKIKLMIYLSYFKNAESGEREAMSLAMILAAITKALILKVPL